MDADISIRCPPSVFDSSRQRYTDFGLGLFVTDASARFGAFGSMLTGLLPQLAHSTSYINVCAHALGSVYLMQCNRERDVDLESIAASAYSSSLRLIKGELNAQPSGSVPLIFACLFLVAVETLLGQPQQALVHSRAAHQMLTHYTKHSYLHQSDERFVSGGNNLEMLFRIRDVHISSFKWDYTTSLTNTGVLPSYIRFSDLDTASLVLYQILGACSAWVADVFRLQYFPALHQASLLVEQGKHIAALSMWLEQFSTKLIPIRDNSGGSYEHALRMRTTCTSWLIRLSHVLDIHETSYDIQASRFEQIVLDAEQVTSIQKQRRTFASQSSANERCVLGAGLVEPLFLVAAKYRHTLWRRRAIVCLEHAGLELPFDGLREAAIAQYIVEYELHRSQDAVVCDEFASQSSDSSEQPSSIPPFGILEQDRVHGLRIAEDDFMHGTHQVMVTFVRFQASVRPCTCNESEYNTLFTQGCYWKTWRKEIQWQRTADGS